MSGALGAYLVLWVGDQHYTEEIAERVRHSLVGELIPHPPAFVSDDDKAATAQAREVVRHPLAGHVQHLGELGGIRRTRGELHQDS